MPDVMINGPAGRLEGRLTVAASRLAPLALLLHPHPRHGGTMSNGVVQAMARSFYRQGFTVLRFNFRGVGRSQGVFDGGEGELNDAAAALDWFQSAFPDAQECWMGGFSFGALVGMQLLMRRPDISRFVAVTPPAHQNDFSFLAPCPSSGLIIQGDSDDLTPEPAVARLAHRLGLQPDIQVDYRLVPGGNHFYTARTALIESYIDHYVQQNRPLSHEQPTKRVAFG